jgi:hypothetical protein
MFEEQQQDERTQGYIVKDDTEWLNMLSSKNIREQLQQNECTGIKNMQWIT